MHALEIQTYGGEVVSRKWRAEMVVRRSYILPAPPTRAHRLLGYWSLALLPSYRFAPLPRTPRPFLNIGILRTRFGLEVGRRAALTVL